MRQTWIPISLKKNGQHLVYFCILGTDCYQLVENGLKYKKPQQFCDKNNTAILRLPSLVVFDKQ